MSSVAVCSNCHCSSALLALWTPVGKELTSWLSADLVQLHAALIVCVFSRFVFGSGCEIRLFRFLIIVFLSTFEFAVSGQVL